MSELFRVLIVCTGNICRSPMAQTMFEDKLRKKSIIGVSVESAGTFALEGEDMPNEAKASLVNQGYQVGKHEAQQVTPEILANSDLILTATEEHRAEIVRIYTKANRNAFTLKELHNILEFMNDPEREVEIETSSILKEKVRIASSSRGYPVSDGSLDLEDPYQQGQQAFDVTMSELEPLIESITSWIGDEQKY